MSKALRIAMEEIPTSSEAFFPSFLTWHPFYFDTNGTACYREFMKMMACFSKNDKPNTSSREYAEFLVCLNKHKPPLI